MELRSSLVPSTCLYCVCIAAAVSALGRESNWSNYSNGKSDSNYAFCKAYCHGYNKTPSARRLDAQKCGYNHLVDSNLLAHIRNDQTTCPSLFLCSHKYRETMSFRCLLLRRPLPSVSIFLIVSGCSIPSQYLCRSKHYPFKCYSETFFSHLAQSSVSITQHCFVEGGCLSANNH